MHAGSSRAAVQLPYDTARFLAHIQLVPSQLARVPRPRGHDAKGSVLRGKEVASSLLEHLPDLPNALYHRILAQEDEFV
jgi:hypothetical protein